MTLNMGHFIAQNDILAPESALAGARTHWHYSRHACMYTRARGREAKFFFPPQLWTPSTNSFAYSQSELHDMNMNDLRLRNKTTHARGLVILLPR